MARLARWPLMGADILRVPKEDLRALRGRLRVTARGQEREHTLAVEQDEEVDICLLLPCLLGAFGGHIRVVREQTGEEWIYPLSYRFSERGLRAYAVTLPKGSLEVGLYHAYTVLDSIHGALGAHGEGELSFLPLSEGAGCFQLTVSHSPYPMPAWLLGGVIYHIFVDRFFRAGNAPVTEGGVLADFSDGIPEYPAYPGAPLRNNTFFGGDLWGVIEGLPHIAALGTRLIYLSPIFRSSSNHRYDTGDYMEVDAMLGGKEALVSLIRAAEQYGIRVMLDGVFNHTGSDSRYFNRMGRYPTLGAYESLASPYASWYRFYDFPDQYECWWGIDILPRLMLTEPSCRDFFIGKEGVVAHYAALGIGGLRLDVADELTGDFIEGVKRRLCERVSDAVLYGEVWEDASNKIAYGRRCTYYLGRELDGVMNYPLRTALIDYLRHGDCRALRCYFEEILPHMPQRAEQLAMNLLGSHDTPRILTALAAPPAEGRDNAYLASYRMTAEERERGERLLRGAYLLLGTLSGIPSVYYGDEMGMEGYSDPFNRMPMRREGDEALLKRYLAVGELRRFPHYATGTVRLYHLSPRLLIFGRHHAGEVALTVFNNGEVPIGVALPTEARVLLSEEGDAGLVPPHDGGVYLLAEGSPFLVNTGTEDEYALL